MPHGGEENGSEPHNFPHPPGRCDPSQRKNPPPAGTFRSNAGVSASSVSEQARKAAPKRHVLQKIRRDIILATCPRMGVILWRVWKKTDSSQSSKNLLPGSWNQVAKKYSNVINTGRFLI